MKYRLIILVLLVSLITAGTAAALTTNGTVYVASFPPGATILINGNPRGTTDQFVYDVAPGLNQNLTLTLTGYEPKTIWFNVTAGNLTVLAPLTLTKQDGVTPPPPPTGNGTVYVASFPPGATILINGITRGTTDQFVYNVPAGADQNVTLTLTGYNQYTMLVDVPVNGTTVLPPVTLTKQDGVTPPPPPTGNGTVYVASFPPGALIKINGTPYGVTNKFVNNVPAGAHQTLTLTLTGYKQYDGFVDVPVNGTTVLPPVTLEKEDGVTPHPPSTGNGTVYVASFPPGALIKINGTPYGVTNKFVNNVPAGAHQTLTLTLTGYKQYDGFVDVPVNGTNVLAPITLTPLATTGTLYVSSTPWNASIWIDSSYYGQTNKIVTGVPAGNNRNLTLIKSGYLQKTVLVNVTAGQVSLLPRITLTPIP